MNFDTVYFHVWKFLSQNLSFVIVFLVTNFEVGNEFGPVQNATIRPATNEPYNPTIRLGINFIYKGEFRLHLNWTYNSNFGNGF